MTIDQSPIQYKFDPISKTLYLRGNGPMRDYGGYYNPIPWKNHEIEKVIIEEGINVIGGYAFAGCSSLKSITIPDSITSIENNAFAGCTDLTSIIIPNSVTSIKSHVFYGCKSLTSIIIPDSVTSIGTSVFLKSGLKSIDVSENNQNYCSIDGVLFTKDKKKLVEYPHGRITTSYIIPQGTEIIGDCAFSECSFLRLLQIPDTVVTIENCAFYNCLFITLTIPCSVTNLCPGCFERCRINKLVILPTDHLNVGELFGEESNNEIFFEKMNRYPFTIEINQDTTLNNCPSWVTIEKRVDDQWHDA